VKLTVVIVSYNVKYYLDQCLEALTLSIRGHRLEAEIYVVDNHSKDGSIGYLRQRYSDVHFVESPHNLGFARANNIAIRKSKADYVLLLNPDTVVGYDVLPEVLAFMDSHLDAGSLGVHMIDSAGKSAKESRRGLPSPMVAFYKMTGLCSCFPKSKRFGHYYMSDMPWHLPGKVEVVSGAFCLLRKAALDKVGYLDEDFFMYGEDIDLSCRVLKGGYHNYYYPKVILHYKGESTQKSSFRYVHVFYEAMLIFFRKHYSGMTWLLSVPIKVAIYAKAALALSRMLMDKVQRNLGFVTYDGKLPVYLLVGNLKMLDACCKILQERGLQADSVVIDAVVKETSGVKEACVGDKCGKNEIIRNGIREIWKNKINAALEKYGSSQMVYIVFSPAFFSYDALFEYISESPSIYRKLAFYHVESNRIVTDDEVFG